MLSEGQVADANLFRRTSQTAVGGQLPYEGEPFAFLHFIYEQRTTSY